MSRKYKNPPLEEVLCYFEFVPSKDWDESLIDEFYEKIKGEFPIRKKTTEDNKDFTQFWKQNEKGMIQIGENFLAYNQLMPYPNWDVFKSRPLEFFPIYKDLIQPNGLNKLGLRYMNRVIFDKINGNLYEHLDFAPTVPSRLEKPFDSFDSVVGVSYNDQRDRLYLHIMSLEYDNPEEVSFLLDLFYVMEKSEKITLDQVESWLEEAHNNIESAFEACFTKKCKKEFFGLVEN